MAVLDTGTRAALIARVARGTTTLADAQLLDRLLPRTAMRAADTAMPEAWSAWHSRRNAERIAHIPLEVTT